MLVSTPFLGRILGPRLSRAKAAEGKGVIMVKKRKSKVKDACGHQKATTCVHLLAGAVRLVMAFLILVQYVNHWSV